MTDRSPAAPPRLLLTGFAPFGEFQVNPSWELARSFQDTTIGMVAIETALLPVDWQRAWPALQEALARVTPRWVLMLGLGSTRPTVNAEVRARNITNPLRDNAGALPPPDDRIEPGGPPYRLATIPATLVAERFQFAGVPAVVSTDAGAFLCNWALYKALQAARDLPGLQGVGFIHVPPLPEQGGPVIPVAALRHGLTLVIESIVAGAAPLYSLVEAEIAAEHQPAARGAAHG